MYKCNVDNTFFNSKIEIRIFLMRRYVSGFVAVRFIYKELSCAPFIKSEEYPSVSRNLDNRDFFDSNSIS